MSASKSTKRVSFADGTSLTKDAVSPSVDTTTPADNAASPPGDEDAPGVQAPSSSTDASARPFLPFGQPFLSDEILDDFGFIILTDKQKEQLLGLPLNKVHDMYEFHVHDALNPHYTLAATIDRFMRETHGKIWSRRTETCARCNEKKGKSVSSM